MSSSPSPRGNPSPAELLQRIRNKVSAVVLWPTVTERIEALKQAKKVKAQTSWDQEYRTVFHLDLIKAILNGAVVDSCPLTDPVGSWVVTIEGIDTVGDPLTVMVQLSKSASEPLQITEFSIPLP